MAAVVMVASMLFAGGLAAHADLPEHHEHGDVITVCIAAGAAIALAVIAVFDARLRRRLMIPSWSEVPVTPPPLIPAPRLQNAWARAGPHASQVIRR